MAKLRLNFPFVPFKLAPNPPSNSNFLRSFFSGFFNQREKSTVNRRVDAFKAIAKDKQQGRRAWKEIWRLTGRWVWAIINYPIASHLAIKAKACGDCADCGEQQVGRTSPWGRQDEVTSPRISGRVRDLISGRSWILSLANEATTTITNRSWRRRRCAPVLPAMISCTAQWAGAAAAATWRMCHRQLVAPHLRLKWPPPAALQPPLRRRPRPNRWPMAPTRRLYQRQLEEWHRVLFLDPGPEQSPPAVRVAIRSSWSIITARAITIDLRLPIAVRKPSWDLQPAKVMAPQGWWHLPAVPHPHRNLHPKPKPVYKPKRVSRTGWPRRAPRHLSRMSMRWPAFSRRSRKHSRSGWRKGLLQRHSADYRSSLRIASRTSDPRSPPISSSSGWPHRPPCSR